MSIKPSTDLCEALNLFTDLLYTSNQLYRAYETTLYDNYLSINAGVQSKCLRFTKANIDELNSITAWNPADIPTMFRCSVCCEAQRYPLGSGAHFGPCAFCIVVKAFGPPVVIPHLVPKARTNVAKEVKRFIASQDSTGLSKSHLWKEFKLRQYGDSPSVGYDDQSGDDICADVLPEGIVRRKA